MKFWDAEKIQKFWAGVSFHEPGDPVDLSYSLAEILVRLLLEEGDCFGNFVLNADAADAGRSAAFKFLDRSLGELVSTFLGEGDWQPKPSQIADLWKSWHEKSE